MTSNPKFRRGENYACVCCKSSRAPKQNRQWLKTWCELSSCANVTNWLYQRNISDVDMHMLNHYLIIVTFLPLHHLHKYIRQKKITFSVHADGMSAFRCIAVSYLLKIGLTEASLTAVLLPHKQLEFTSAKSKIQLQMHLSERQIFLQESICVTAKRHKSKMLQSSFSRKYINK